MKHEPTKPHTDTREHTPDEDRDEDRDEAVIAADATGMIAGERLITEAEIEEGLAGKKP
jgi:hypothetical protein